MSTENLNEMTLQSCHIDEVLEHIDDESQQEYFEKKAPKAQEELLNINQDCDSSPDSEVNEQSLEINQISQNNFNVSELLNKIENKGFEENLVNIEEMNDPVTTGEIITIENSENISLKEEEQIKSYEIDTTEEHYSHKSDASLLNTEFYENNEIFEETELQDKHSIEADNKENDFLKNDSIENEKSQFIAEEFVEDDVDPVPFDESVTNEEIELKYENNVQINNDIIDKTGSNDSKVNKDMTETQKKPKDVKTLSSSYNNDDNINSECEICKKTVYPLEKLSANNRIFHKQCFRCTKCRCALLTGNFSFNNDKPYCRPHYIELFKKRGRYDEIDVGETAAQPTTINDILTDELPAPDITKNLLAKFRDLEAGTVSNSTIPSSNADVTDEFPAPNTTKNLMERFSALGKDGERDPKRKPMIEIPRSDANGLNSGACENQPIVLPKDVARANEPSHDELPEQGITKNLVNRFRDLESTGVSSK